MIMVKGLNSEVFLTKIHEKITNGDFDEYLTYPFMSKELFYSCLKNRLARKIEEGHTPILSDAEIKTCLQEVKETAVNVIAVYLKVGIIAKVDDQYKITKLGSRLLKLSYME
jgi:hypothetical protein